MPTTLGGTREPRRTAVQSAAVGHPAYSQTLPAAAESARTARKLIVTALHTWSLEALADAAKLLVTELVSNAVTHVRCHDVRVCVTRVAEHRVRVAVVDKSRTHPVPRSASAADETGRGLDVVERLADSWGSDLLPWGKRVWCEISVDVEP